MLKSSCCISLLLLTQHLLGTCAVLTTRYSEDEFEDDASSMDCVPQPTNKATTDTSLHFKTLLCRIGRLIRSVLQQLSASKRPVVIVRGLEIVPTTEDLLQSGSLHAAATDTSVLGRFSDYLRTHELNIKFSDLLDEESERHAARDADPNGVNAEEARHKKDKGHGHSMLMISMMFSKLLAVVTLGGISAVAMKALGIAMAALMMSSMHAMKMHGHSNKDEGHQGRRKRRSVGITMAAARPTGLPLPLPYDSRARWEGKSTATI